MREEPVRRGSVMDEFRSGRFGAAPEEAVAADAGTADITPDDFDREAFLRVAKENFVKFQKAWDTGNVIELSDFTTQDLFIEITHALRERGELTDERLRETLESLRTLAETLSSKYTRGYVRRRMPEEWAFVLDELHDPDNG